MQKMPKEKILNLKKGQNVESQEVARERERARGRREKKKGEGSSRIEAAKGKQLKKSSQREGSKRRFQIEAVKERQPKKIKQKRRQKLKRQGKQSPSTPRSGKNWQSLKIVLLFSANDNALRGS